VAYTYERPDLPALAELDRVLQNVTEELAAWRRRTLKAEAELKEAQASGGVVAGAELKDSRQRVIELETENQALRQRIESAKERLRVLAARLAFLEQHGGGNAA
jgi:predicted  nucleic acid-binding Zn-ribbon protein